jgi:hypothetical protein
MAEDPQLGIGLGMLAYRSPMYNFPGERELGRFGRIARSADSQYVEILAETGILGFCSFLFGWFALFFFLRTIRERYFYMKLAWAIVTISCVFSNPLENTAILFLFLFLITIPLSDSENGAISLSFNRLGRILLPTGGFLMLVLGIYFPYRAHKEFSLAASATAPEQTAQHLASAVRYNPYQPYYQFFFLRRAIDSKPDWPSARWFHAISVLDQSIDLNPLESEFYLYKARVYRRMLAKSPKLMYYSSAVSSYQAALDYNPHNVFYRMEFASFLFHIDRPKLAESEIRKALEAEPAFLAARLLLAEILFSRTSSKEARKEYSKFLAYYQRYGGGNKSQRSPYIRSLLEVNIKQKQRVEELLKTG